MPVLVVPRVFGGTILLTIGPSQAVISVTAIGSDGQLTGIGSSGLVSGIGNSAQFTGIAQNAQVISVGSDGLVSGKD